MKTFSWNLNKITAAFMLRHKKLDKKNAKKNPALDDKRWKFYT